MTFFVSFWDAINSMAKKDQLPVFRAVISYGLFGEHSETLTPTQNAFFSLMQPVLDSSRKKAASGKQGGSKTEAKAKQSRSKTEANGKQTASEKEGEKEKEGEIEKENECYTPKPPKGAKRFAPPTVDEVAEYCFERHNGIDAQHFVDYYAQQKWKLSNGNPMADWKAAVRTWEGRDRKKGKSTGFQTSNPFAEMLEEELNRYEPY